MGVAAESAEGQFLLNPEILRSGGGEEELAGGPVPTLRRGFAGRL